MELTTLTTQKRKPKRLFMMSKIRNLNGTHNSLKPGHCNVGVVYDVKDTKFEWNSQHTTQAVKRARVVYDVKDTKFEWNSQQAEGRTHEERGCL